MYAAPEGKRDISGLLLITSYQLAFIPDDSSMSFCKVTPESPFALLSNLELCALWNASKFLQNWRKESKEAEP